eukprot:NODE_29_length_37665_cov_1.081563.p22 type:complete len:173 gc:universal NODE_29_length_37665_cov_1.081563:10064-9546(-)
MMTTKRSSNSHRFSNILRKISLKNKKYRESQLGVANVIDEYSSDKIPPPKRSNTSQRSQALPSRKQKLIDSELELSRSSSLSSVKNDLPRTTLYEKAAHRQRSKSPSLKSIDNFDEEAEPLTMSRTLGLPHTSIEMNKPSTSDLTEVSDSSIDDPFDKMFTIKGKNLKMGPY